MLKLYHGAISTCSQKVRIALGEKGLSYQAHEVDFAVREHLSPAYLALNPNGVVPTLVHDGQAIVDSSVICEYLDEVFPEPALSPPDATGRARMRAWMRYFEEVPTAAIRIPSFNRRLIAFFQRMSAESFASMTEAMPLRRRFYQQMGQDGFPEDMVAESLERLASCIRRVDTALGDGRPWLLGDQFTIADIVLIPTIVRMEDIGLSHIWADHPAIAPWLARAAARRSFAEAYLPGSRLTEFNPEAIPA